MPSALSIGSKPGTKADSMQNDPKVGIIEISANNRALCRADGRIFEPLEILNLLKQDCAQAERLKGTGYWLAGGLKNGISGHCTIDENGDLAKITGGDWISLPPNRKIYVTSGKNPPHLTVKAASDGNITYIHIDFATEPCDMVKSTIYFPGGNGNACAQLLRAEEKG
ncbi:MAG: hypothetical protein KGI06_02065 [Candidatus Micrarchaeota archaeon]|nr:hypothetical protein [Candidatus Micrarchaeota archaeon]